MSSRPDPNSTAPGTSPQDGSQSPAARLARARAQGDPAALSEALANHAAKLVQEGKIGFARTELDEAIQINQSLGKPLDEARLTQLSATLCRIEGNLVEAKNRALRAVNLADSLGNPAVGNPISVAATVELGEISMIEGHGSSAAYAYSQAISLGEAIGMLEPFKASLLRKKAGALALAGKFSEAAAELTSAIQLLQKNNDPQNTLRARIEQATAYYQAGDAQKGAAQAQAARQSAQAVGDHAALADLDILEATQAITRKDTTAALAAASSARKEALAGRAPVPYISAVAAIARLQESTGDNVTAYATLSTGWATLGDLLGSQAARITFEPLLTQMRQRLGDEQFRRIKTTYEESRRAALRSAGQTTPSSGDQDPSKEVQ